MKFPENYTDFGEFQNRMHGKDMQRFRPRCPQCKLRIRGTDHDNGLHHKRIVAKLHN